MKQNPGLSFLALAIVGFTLHAPIAIAAEDKHGHHASADSAQAHHGKDKHGHGSNNKEKKSSGGHGHGGHGGHHFSPHWASTLSDEQKVAVDKMHLSLDRERFQLRALMEVEQAKLNSLAAQDNADKSAITAQIDKVLDVRRKIMQQRYDHLLEMRAILNEQQRISYDMAVLGRAGVKEGIVK